MFTSDEREATSQLTLKESEMTAGECMAVDVYAEHYGVRSEKKTYNICYERIPTYSPDGKDTHQGVCFCSRDGVVGSNLCYK